MKTETRGRAIAETIVLVPKEAPVGTLATRGDIRMALEAGFSPVEIDYMLDLPEGATARAAKTHCLERLACAA